MPRLDLLLSHSLNLSRKQALRLVRQRRIAAHDGRVLDDPKVKIAPSDLPLEIRVDGEPHVLRDRFHLLQHKPIGVVTAMRDDDHATAYDLLADVPMRRDVRPVGRLDRETSGLLLWTTDGELVHRLTHPKYAVPRTYHAALTVAWSPPSPGFTLEDGHRPNIVELARLDEPACHPALIVPPTAAVLATITITSGRFHEVRRIFAALGSEVVGLARVAYGGVELPRDLPAGDWRPVDLRAAFRGLAPAR